MQAIVLAGGYATRLWPITKNRPKMLLPIGERTVIGTVFNALERDRRIEEVYVSTNEKFADTFEEYLGRSEYEKPQLSVEETNEESEKFGVIGALAQLIDREGLTEDTIVIAGDNLVSFDVSDFLDRFQANQEPILAANDLESYDRASEYGILQLNERSEVVDFQEKPDEPKSTLASVACYGFPNETLPKLDTYLQADRNPDEPGWFIEWLQGRETVHAYTFTEGWFDIGTPESYLDAIAWHLGGTNYIHPDAELDGVTLGENVQIMANAELEDVTIDNSVVFDGTSIRDSEIRRSIIDRNTDVRSLDLSGAVIGEHAFVDSPS